MVIIVMGVSGSGKTTVGQKLAAALGCRFFDADDFHSAQNKAKMGRGEALTDGDRQPWLESLAGLIAGWNKETPLSVLACSALKQKYRDLLSGGGEIFWVYLKGNPELVLERLEKRGGHFASKTILPSQFKDLEEPEAVVKVDIREETDKIVAFVIQEFNQSKGR